MDHDRTPAVSQPLIRRLDRFLASPLAWGVLLLFALAALFRQYLFAPSYWYDEAFVVLAIRARRFAQLLGPQPYNLVSPPGFLWLTRICYALGGDGEWILRLPSFTAGVVALFVMIPLARKVVGRPQALWAFAGLAVSSHFIDHSCDVHPYTFDLLLTEVLLLCAAVLIEPGARRSARVWAVTGLGLIALVGPWLSFPIAFVLGGISLTLAVYLRRQGTRNQWALWLAFNGLVALSGLGLWWFSGRHMYYTGMLEHWGHRGWGGFPDWRSPLAIGRWLLRRPYEIANYGNRDVGLLLAALAIAGAVALVRRHRTHSVLLLGPFALALTAALLGKYPLAHRTTFFLLPCLWLLAAVGFGSVVEWGRARGRNLAPSGLLLVAWNFGQLLMVLAAPHANLDYRGAYQFVHDHREARDAVWSEMAVVHDTYYGIDASLLRDEDFPQAVRLVSRQRLWAVMGAGRRDLRQRLEADGGQVVCAHAVSGLSVLLFEPRLPPAPEAEQRHARGVIGTPLTSSMTK